jgi:hypothetical protein
MLKKLFPGFLGLLFVAGCSTNYSSQSQVDEHAYLQLQGNFQKSIILLDEVSFSADETTKTFKHNDVLVAKFPIEVGAHDLVIKKNGMTVVNRKIFVTNGQTVEVTVP